MSHQFAFSFCLVLLVYGLATAAATQVQVSDSFKQRYSRNPITLDTSARRVALRAAANRVEPKIKLVKRKNRNCFVKWIRNPTLPELATCGMPCITWPSCSVFMYTFITWVMVAVMWPFYGPIFMQYKNMPKNLVKYKLPEWLNFSWPQGYAKKTTILPMPNLAKLVTQVSKGIFKLEFTPATAAFTVTTTMVILAFLFAALTSICFCACVFTMKLRASERKKKEERKAADNEAAFKARKHEIDEANKILMLMRQEERNLRQLKGGNA